MCTVDRCRLLKRQSQEIRLKGDYLKMPKGSTSPQHFTARELLQDESHLTVVHTVKPLQHHLTNLILFLALAHKLAISSSHVTWYTAHVNGACMSQELWVAGSTKSQRCLQYPTSCLVLFLRSLERIPLQCYVPLTPSHFILEFASTSSCTCQIHTTLPECIRHSISQGWVQVKATVLREGSAFVF